MATSRKSEPRNSCERKQWIHSLLWLLPLSSSLIDVSQVVIDGWIVLQVARRINREAAGGIDAVGCQSARIKGKYKSSTMACPDRDRARVLMAFDSKAGCIGYSGSDIGVRRRKVDKPFRPVPQLQEESTGEAPYRARESNMIDVQTKASTLKV
ncbi:hypothetical protein F5148DRAFT_755524 [Russula earlei]|uniref:Uncharacterized protein n=1 Tax=Russula earlei TaxID=71964 RepID=A0ACC0UEG5_9AGAM|nr:hypothetical protein F5148DRAFT_755524 [Russula earlei]